MTLETKNMVNGIDMDQLTQTFAAVEQDPKNGEVAFRVTTKWQGGTRAETQVEDCILAGQRLPRGFTIRTDEPEELLGNAQAPNPQEVLMAGLNACMVVGYTALCALQGIEIESLEIETDGELDLRGFLGMDESVPPGYPEIRYVVRIRANGKAEQLQEIHQMVQATSPNFWNLSRPVKLVSELVVL